jgi:hypothetical protein
MTAMSAPAKTKIRRGRKREKIPRALRAAVIESAKKLRAEFGSLFTATPRLKRRAAGLFESNLPPRRRRPGRPGFRLVTKAIRLRNQLRRGHPELSSKEVWHRIYSALIPDYQNLPLLERRQAERQLHQRARWRLDARDRRRRKPATGKLSKNLSGL